MKNFESRLKKLETLADRIGEPDLPLEEAVKVFEEGMKLSKELRNDLDSIQGKVETLLSAEDEDDPDDVEIVDFDISQPS